MAFNLVRVVVLYAIAGCVHECTHVLAYALVVHERSDLCPFALADFSIVPTKTLLSSVLSVVLGRQTFLPVDFESECPAAFQFTRLVGFIASVAVAAVLELVHRARIGKSNKSEIRLAFWATAFDSACTDLLNVLPRSGAGALLCGNFGIILLNHAWCKSEQGTKTFDVLEKMVYVTMMRGAQSGGVVTFNETGPKPSGDGKATALVGARSRVVNMKRTDLSKLVRAKAERESGGRRMVSQNVTRLFAGHTRFATTSKATMDGTHPHQWSPPQLVAMYGQDQTAPGSSNVKMENYITHNGDFDFYNINNQWFELGDMQAFLERATGFAAPSVVDSAAIAGVVDILRAQGSFTLATRYVACFDMDTSGASADASVPSLAEFARLGKVFELELNAMLVKYKNKTIREIGFDLKKRAELAIAVGLALEIDACVDTNVVELLPFQYYLDTEKGGSVTQLIERTVDAFFDNDNLFVTRSFLQNAKGSFGLSITNSIDAQRQICVAARGQTISVAFYPKKGLICYGSEQAAVKAGLSIATPDGDVLKASKTADDADDLDAVRLDLDDLNGEVCLLDWGEGDVAVSLPSSEYETFTQMTGSLRLVLAMDAPVQRAPWGLNEKAALSRPEKITKTNALKDIDVAVDVRSPLYLKTKFFHRVTRLEGNEFIKPLLPDSEDLVLSDIRDIPSILQSIQQDWRNEGTRSSISLNRLTAWNLSRCLRKRLDRNIARTAKSHRSVDVVVTGCEVSLWLAEQLASDLQNAFPKLKVTSISSNKILGLFGQDLPIPTIGHPRSKKNDDFTDSIVIVVSHSGGTFAPLASTNLLVASTKSIFVIASEWDTQIGKQLRSIPNDGEAYFASRIFSTDVGVRPAEPCSVSVAATQQLLTQIFMHMSLVILNSNEYVESTGAVITKHDLAELETCNRKSITALTQIVGTTVDGNAFNSETEKILREQGAQWSAHVLEGVKGWILSFIYIVVTVTAGYPLITGIATAAGLAATWAFYLTRFFDALLYVFLPQICITLIRLVQGRDLKHRMTGRTVVIGDVPWVAQSAEAFLSKIFACSYSAAGLNVLSGNPTDHLVHRHTHRVVRGALLIVGRPDGRLSALTSAEATASLSLAQASSIQSFGGTCESITIGHSNYKLPLSKNAIFLERNRPLFLCEKLVCEREGNGSLDGRSPGSLLGVYNKYHEEGADFSIHELTHENAVTIFTEARIKANRRKGNLRAVFNSIDEDGSGLLDLDEFTVAYRKIDDSLSDEQIEKLFKNADSDGSGELDYDEFCDIMTLGDTNLLSILEKDSRNERGLLLVEPSEETYFGESIRKSAPEKVKPYALVESQELSMQLYESRVASLQRFVAMTVMFHEIGDRVQRFWRYVSFGYLGYRMDRTHSIMRIATTASPVSGAEVRDRRHFISLNTAFNNALAVIENSGRIRMERMLR